MGIAQKIDDGIDAWVISQQRARYVSRWGYYNPSEIPYCYRQMHFRREVAKDSRLDLAQRGLVGTLLHEYYIKPAIEHLFPNAKRLNSERDFTLVIDWDRQIFIRGRADHLVHLKEGDRRFILEVKSIANLWAQKGADLWSYEMQTQPSMIGLEADEWYLIFVSRAVGSHRTYMFERERDKLDEAIGRVIQIHDYHEKGLIPPAEGLTNLRFRKNMARGKIKYWRCDYCDFSGECMAYERPPMEEKWK